MRPTRPAPVRWAIRAALVLLAVEAAARVATAPVLDNPLALGRLTDERTALASGVPDAQPEGQGQRLDVVPHPFVGYVHAKDAFDGIGTGAPGDRPRANAHGFLDANELLQERDPERVIVGIVGGSVAWWLGSQGDAALAARLGESSRFAGKEVRFVRMALGGYKQPQQLMALGWLLALGGQLDVLVNLDGYNEVALSTGQTWARGVYPFFPREWDLLVDTVSDIETSRRIGRVTYLDDARRRWAESFDGTPARALASARLAWKLRDRTLAAELVRARTELQSRASEGLSFRARGPGPEDFDAETIWPAIAEVWRSSSLQLKALCDANGITYFHFLQPNQYVEGAKPMGEWERTIAIAERNDARTGVERGYPFLLAAADELRTAGVRFVDLTMVFEDVEEPLYIDPFCHVGRRGSEILGDRIGAEILGAFGATSVFRGFDPAAWNVVLDRPGIPIALQPTGIFDDGERRAIHAASTELSCRSRDPDIASVSSSGELTGRRLGSTEIVVVREGHEARVRVDTTWGPVLDLDAGGGELPLTPHLEAVDARPTSGADFRMVVGDVPDGRRGLLYVGEVPPGDFLAHGLPEGVALLPLVSDGGRAEIVVPIPDDAALVGKAFFCRALFVPNDEEFRVVGWSNLLALTVLE
jgi:hypothetical protein